MHPSPHLDGKVILITGGTGSFGQAFLKEILTHHNPKAVRVYSRDELKQYELAAALDDGRVRCVIGDVRDRDRLIQASHGVDVMVHAAAMKQVPICEYNPFEAVQTNIIGAENVVAAAIENNVPKTVALSTDKAVNPVNLYGATKLAAEKIVTQGNVYAADRGVRFACVRYGNVVGSRGSVVPLFKRQAEEGQITITDESMTRFWITLEHAVQLVVDSLAWMVGGEVFVPRIASMRIVDLADALAPGLPRRIIGIRPGEKIHEVLITADESRHAVGFDDHYAIYPSFPFWRDEEYPAGEQLTPGFRYASDTNDDWLTPEQIRAMAMADVPALQNG
jgi:UDP-N-acetylglucosamine 4,6-dehydratase (inverting)